MQNKNNISQYIAGGCFVGSIVNAFQVYIRFSEYKELVGELPYFIGLVLIAVSLFTCVPILTSAGAGICVVDMVTHLSFNGIDAVWIIVDTVLPIAFYILLVVGGINKKKAEQFYFAACGVEIVRFVIDISVTNGIIGHSNSFYLGYFFMIVGTFMMGMAFVHTETKTKKGVSAASGGAVHEMPNENPMDRITKLKGLLDSGVITQEEFEKKKKEILGL